MHTHLRSLVIGGHHRESLIDIGTFSAPECLMLLIAFTAMMWIPYVVARIVANGTFNCAYLDGLHKVCTYQPLYIPVPPWAERAEGAHRNAVENLVLFASMVLLASSFDVPNIDGAAVLYMYARLLHWPAMVLNFPYLRTLCFGVGWAALFSMIATCAAKCAADKAMGLME